MRVRVKNPRRGPRLLACDPSPAATYAALIVVREPLLILHCLHCHRTLFIHSNLPLFFTGSLSLLFRLPPVCMSPWEEGTPDVVASRCHDRVKEEEEVEKEATIMTSESVFLTECSVSFIRSDRKLEPPPDLGR